MITWDKYAYVRGSYESIPISGIVNGKQFLAYFNWFCWINMDKIYQYH